MSSSGYDPEGATRVECYLTRKRLEPTKFSRDGKLDYGSSMRNYKKRLPKYMCPEKMVYYKVHGTFFPRAEYEQPLGGEVI